MSNLVGSVRIEPPSARPGESVLVQVLDAQGNAYTNQNLDVTIDGVLGASQYLQYPSEGRRRITVIARHSDGSSEKQTFEIAIEGHPLSFSRQGRKQEVVMIGLTQSSANPYVAKLSLGSTDDARRLSPPTKISYDGGPWIFGKVQTARLVEGASARSPLARVVASYVSGDMQVRTRHLSHFSRASDTQKSWVMDAVAFDLTGGHYVAALDKLFSSRARTQQQYQWDFGDGETATTRTPEMEHDYFKAIDHSIGYGQFVVTCTAVHAKVTVRRSVTVYSAYSKCKQAGTIVPHTRANIFAHRRDLFFEAALTIYNVEDYPLILTQISISPYAQDQAALAVPRPFRNMRSPVIVPARSQMRIGLTIPIETAKRPTLGSLPSDITGFSVIYAGNAGDYPVRCTCNFDIPLNEQPHKANPGIVFIPNIPVHVMPWRKVSDSFKEIINHHFKSERILVKEDVSFDPETGTTAVVMGNVAERVNSRVLTAANNVLEVSGRQITQLISGSGIDNLGRVRFEKQALNGAIFNRLKSAKKGIHLFDGPPPPGFVAEGQICDPDNLSEEERKAAEAGQLVCQRTDVVVEASMPGRWMNARKGDVILSPGGSGLIGEMMLRVDPQQLYSHSGIMTRNYDEIAHSTGSQARILDNPAGVIDGSEGLDPDALKYVWPGAIVQGVEASIRGEDFPDPVTGKMYSIASFGPQAVGITLNDQMIMIPPQVLKPDPVMETAEVRSALNAIATDCKAAAGRPGQVGKYHYRWYCYTDPTIGMGEAEPIAAGWAFNTKPSVCSSFIWLHARARGAILESGSLTVEASDLEPTDVRKGAAVRAGTPEGLYLYTAAERKSAGEYLYEKVYKMAFDKAGWAGNMLTDAADDVANQFLNCFASDIADGKDSDDWRNAVDATAVSPDDMMFWDGPNKGGLWGYVEPAIYREPRIESYTESRWVKVVTRGRIFGTIRDAAGRPTAGALVQVFDGKFANTDGQGHYALDNVPLGGYTVTARKVIDDILQTASQNIWLNAASMSVDIDMALPAEKYRVAKIIIDFRGVDDESWPANDEVEDPGPEYLELELGPDKLVNSYSRTYHWGGEVRVVYTITVRLLVTNAIDVDIQGMLYEGTSEDTKDLDGVGNFRFIVDAGQSKASLLTIRNTDEDADDSGTLAVTVENAINDN